MSLPGRSDKVWEKLASGSVTHKFDLFAANMAVNRTVRSVSTGKTNLASAAAQLFEFFQKYEDLTVHEFKSLR